MTDTIITVEQLSKLYKLGTIGTGSLRQDMQRWWNSAVLKKKDPFFDLDENDQKESTQFLWALRDINFEVKRGEALGIIGSNGSGKSTLLKIISRIVRPTHGTVRGNGKVSSLLEVGTGFHQELTGRENIYISGYILGMTKHEIRSKFDEIVAFSGIEQFIDTPVKRYSSGMYVRLAFAVAAHLEPDILIVDEVLAVGDADFQKKCLGKMREVSHSDGRTVLFVSHSMQAVNNLCSKALWLKKGKMQDIGEANEVVTRYINGMQKTNWKQAWETPQEAPGNNWVRVREVQMVPDLASPDSYVDTRTALTFHFSFWNMVDQVDLTVWIQLFSYSGECVFELPSTEVASQRGVLSGACTIPGNFLNEGAYYISFMILKDTNHELFYLEECISFDVEDFRGDVKWYGKWSGAVRPLFPFRLEQTEGSLALSPDKALLL